jgi:hypothetical protein
MIKQYRFWWRQELNSKGLRRCCTKLTSRWIFWLCPFCWILNNYKTQCFGNMIYFHLQVRGLRQVLGSLLTDATDYGSVLLADGRTSGFSDIRMMGKVRNSPFCAENNRLDHTLPNKCITLIVAISPAVSVRWLVISFWFWRCVIMVN